MHKETRLKVSVIIPTYHDWDRLLLCIIALKQQTYPKELFEVIIVNNDPNDMPPPGYNLPAGFRLITEAKPGSYAARNAALKIATGDIYGFTDSDCIPFPGWIESAVKILENKKYSRVAGNIELYYDNPKKPTSAELYEKVFAFKQRNYVKQYNAAVTGNMFTWKYVMDQVGHFNDNLFSGGDFEWSSRAQKNGFNITFGEDVSIYHPARKDLNLLVKKSKRVSGGHAMMNGKNRLSLIIRYIKAVKPPFYTIKEIIEYGKELTVIQKLQVFLTRYYIDYICSQEALLISLGKPSNRE